MPGTCLGKLARRGRCRFIVAAFRPADRGTARCFGTLRPLPPTFSQPHPGAMPHDHTAAPCFRARRAPPCSPRRVTSRAARAAMGPAGNEVGRGQRRTGTRSWARSSPSASSTTTSRMPGWTWQIHWNQSAADTLTTMASPASAAVGVGGIFTQVVFAGQKLPGEDDRGAGGHRGNAGLRPRPPG